MSPGHDAAAGWIRHQCLRKVRDPKPEALNPLGLGLGVFGAQVLRLLGFSLDMKVLGFGVESWGV